MVDLKGFTEAIDVIGGIDVYLDTEISGLYPTDNFDYKTVTFKKGWNKMSGQTALQYSRIRKEVIPASEIGDFARSKRQQKVIQAVIEKASKSETFTDAKKVWELLGVVKKNTKTTKLTVEDVQAGVGLLKDKGKPLTYTYVLDFYAGGSLGRLIDVISADPYLIGPVKGQGQWQEIQEFIKEYLQEPGLASMNKKVVVYDGGNADYQSRYAALTFKFYYVIFENAGTYIIPSKTAVYAVGGKTYDKSAAFLATGVKGTATEVPTDFPVSVGKNVAIVVVL